MVYLNNIIIYSNSKEEHKEHIKWVLWRLHDKNILIIIKKYKAIEIGLCTCTW